MREGEGEGFLTKSLNKNGGDDDSNAAQCVCQDV